MINGVSQSNMISAGSCAVKVRPHIKGIVGYSLWLIVVRSRSLSHPVVTLPQFFISSRVFNACQIC